MRSDRILLVLLVLSNIVLLPFLYREGTVRISWAPTPQASGPEAARRRGGGGDRC